LAREQHDDLNNAPHSCNWCVSLTPATKTEVRTICPDLIVSFSNAAKMLGGVVVALARDCGNHINDGDSCWVLVSLPNLHGLSAQEGGQLLLDVRHGSSSHMAAFSA